MPVNPSHAGPYQIGLDNDLGTGTSKHLNLTGLSIRGKRGYLKKVFGSRGGMDYVYVTNSSQYDALVSVSGGDGFQKVPSASSVNVDGPISNVTIRNESGSTIPAGDLTVSVGNGARNEEKAEFSVAKLASDVIPGF